ncbi:MAG: PIN domain-containing protein [Acidobacteriota bacterium]
MRRAVFDTNVIVSGFLSPDGPPGRIVEWLRAGRIQAVLDDRIAAEYADVLARPKFALPSDEVAFVLAAIVDAAFRVESAPEHQATGLPDATDAPFLECARTAGVPLVTGNPRHYPRSVAREVSVTTPAQYVASLRHSGRP